MKIDITDKKFNKLTAISFIGKMFHGKRPHYYWKWQCDCGTIKIIARHYVVSSRIKSCGCLKKICQKKGEDSPSWKGGRRIEEGYVLIYLPDHPKAKSNGYVREHTVIMEKVLGRSLHKDENVHHKNGNKEDNRIENLELWSTSQPSGQRVEDKLKWAKEIIERYANFDDVTRIARFG